MQVKYSLADMAGYIELDIVSFLDIFLRFLQANINGSRTWGCRVSAPGLTKQRQQ